MKLMIAYRLHFEAANLDAIERRRRAATSGGRGSSRRTFAMQVKQDNIRTSRERGGGPLLDLGIYCVNAARYAVPRGADRGRRACRATTEGDRRFNEVDEQVTAVLRFPGRSAGAVHLQLRRATIIRR